MLKCQLGSEWHMIGYVVKELCDDVLEALNKKDILSTKFAWVKFKVMPTTGPGYYTAIHVTKKNKWPPIVYRFASSFY